jgi:hypothetical protein
MSWIFGRVSEYYAVTVPFSELSPGRFTLLAAVGIMVQDFVFYPLDVIRTRLQAARSVRRCTAIRFCAFPGWYLAHSATGSRSRWWQQFAAFVVSALVVRLHARVEHTIEGSMAVKLKVV